MSNSIINHSVEQIKVQDEDGQVNAYIHSVTLSNGRTLQFSERNIFDFGRVINPNYAIAEGREKGGLVQPLHDGRKQAALGLAPRTDGPAELWFWDFSDGEYEHMLPNGEWVPGRIKDCSIYNVALTETVHASSEMDRLFGAGDTYTTYTDLDGNTYADRDLTLHMYCAAHFQRTVNAGGWSPVRPLDCDEDAAYRYLLANGKFARTGIRM